MTTPPASSACRPIDLRGPTGARVDLNGAWQGGVTFHEVRQSGDCVWWVGFSSWPNEELGQRLLLTFSGRLRSDFTLSGQWVPIYTAELTGTHGEATCPVTFQISFGEDGEAQLTTESFQDDPCAYYAETMERVDGPP